MPDDERPEDGTEAAVCMPCRGTGKVISSLGGETKGVPCPWCEGTGTPIAEHDAQARWRNDGEAEAVAPKPETD